MGAMGSTYLMAKLWIREHVNLPSKKPLLSARVFLSIGVGIADAPIGLRY
jgi:hypothetical protein